VNWNIPLRVKARRHKMCQIKGQSLTSKILTSKMFGSKIVNIKNVNTKNVNTLNGEKPGLVVRAEERTWVQIPPYTGWM
jgi:hypothetical protein